MAQWRFAVRTPLRSTEKFLPTLPPPPPPPPSSKMNSRLVARLLSQPSPRQARRLPTLPPSEALQVNQKRCYHYLTRNPLNSLSSTKPSQMLLKRSISLRSILNSVQDSSAVRIQKLSKWLKEAAKDMLLALKESLTKYGKYLKKGFEDRAVSLVFNAHVIAGYGILCWGIEEMQMTLSDAGNEKEGMEDDIAQLARKVALLVLFGLKKVLMFWSDGETKEKVRQQTEVVNQMSTMLEKSAEQDELTRADLEDIKARINLLEEEMQKADSDQVK